LIFLWLFFKSLLKLLELTNRKLSLHFRLISFLSIQPLFRTFSMWTWSMWTHSPSIFLIFIHSKSRILSKIIFSGYIIICFMITWGLIIWSEGNSKAMFWLCLAKIRLYYQIRSLSFWWFYEINERSSLLCKR